MSCDWGRDEAQLAAMTCQIASEPSRCFEPVAAPCGARARWWTDDIGPLPVWACEPCMNEILMHSDSIDFQGEDQ